MADDIEEQYSRHKKLKEAGYYDENKSKADRLNIIKQVDESFQKTQKEAERAKSMWDKFRERHGIVRGGGSSGTGGALDLEGTGPKGLKRTPKMRSGGKVSSASKRADGIAIRGKTRA